MRVPFTVSGGSTTATNSNSSTLPRTGADHIPELTAAGLGLVAVGGVVVIAARRRRNEDAAPPAGLA
jgi:LPXTG-motif cell wall-anchored protein